MPDYTLDTPDPLTPSTATQEHELASTGTAATPFTAGQVRKLMEADDWTPSVTMTDDELVSNYQLDSLPLFYRTRDGQAFFDLAEDLRQYDPQAVGISLAFKNYNSIWTPDERLVVTLDLRGRIRFPASRLREVARAVELGALAEQTGRHPAKRRRARQ